MLISFKKSLSAFGARLFHINLELTIVFQLREKKKQRTFRERFYGVTDLMRFAKKTAANV